MLRTLLEVMMEAARKRGELVTLSTLLCFRGLMRSQRGDLAAVRDLGPSAPIFHAAPDGTLRATITP